ncbi:MAG TPA: hypothetical protein VLF62_00165 [Candidatus Saccharimonadales bacterium]|nr:hypothetical protein [Candidatus Saccharimonadales bacterium]
MSEFQRKRAAEAAEQADHERKRAEAIASSLANTKEFVHEMRARDIGNLALFARRSALAPLPPKKLWQKKSAITPIRHTEHTYSLLARGWAVWPPSAEGYNDYLFVVDHEEEPTVYKSVRTPSESSSMNIAADTPPVKPGEKCLILPVPDHLQPDAFVTADAFAGEYGAGLLLGAMKRRGQPGY